MDKSKGKFSTNAPVLVSTTGGIIPYQLLFLEHLAELVPEVLSRLRDDVLPLFKAIPDETRQDRQFAPVIFQGISEEYKQIYGQSRDILHWESLTRHANMSEVAALQAALTGWASRYNMCVPWLLDSALQTLDSLANPSAWGPSHLQHLSDNLHFAALSYRHAPPNDRVVFEHYAWRTGSWERYADGQIEAFRNHLRAHKAQVLSSGYDLDDKENYDHFAWVALAYGARLNFAQIADLPEDRRTLWRRSDHRETSPDQSDIGKAVRSTAAAIGLATLSALKGRPRKSGTDRRRS